MSKQMLRWLHKTLVLVLVFQMVLWPAMAAADVRRPGVYTNGRVFKAIAPDATPTGGNVLDPTTAVIKTKQGNLQEIEQLKDDT